MKTFELTGTLRSEFGKKAAKGLRKQDPLTLLTFANSSTLLTHRS